MPRRQLIALLIALACFAAIVPVQRKLSEIRNREGLAQSAADIIEVTGNAALAGWRAIIADVFWVKADALQVQGKLENIRWFLWAITKLQPDMPEVWDFISWHVSYNLFHEVESREDKWALMYEGLTLGLEGLRKNPKSADLYHSMGYRFYHKFDSHYFPDAPYFRKRWRETKRNDEYSGKDNFQVAIELLHKSVALEPNEIRSRFACHVYDRWVDVVYNEGDLEKSLKLAEEAVKSWDLLFKEFDVHGTAASMGFDLNKKFLDEARRREEAIDKDVAAAEAEKAGDLKKALGLSEQSLAIWTPLAKESGTFDDAPRDKVAAKVAELKKKLGIK